MRKYVLYGNCQVLALKPFLESNHSFAQKYEYISTERVHNMTGNDIESLYSILPKVDLIIHIPVSKNYKDEPRLSTKSILNHLTSKCRSILFPVCYFTGYNPELFYLKEKNNNKITNQFDYHDINFLQTFIENKNQNITDIVSSKTFYDSKFLYHNLALSIEELKSREQNCFGQGIKTDIKVSNFIESNFKDLRLFYTFNHPSIHLLKYISSEVIKLLEFEDTHCSCRLDPLSANIYPIYRSIQENLNLRFQNKPQYKIRNKNYSLGKIHQEYRKYYQKLPVDLLRWNIENYQHNK